jgi:hypothetical protein
MQFIRQIYTDLPDSIITPIELRHRKVEIIILPLDDIQETQDNSYHVIEIDDIARFSREELYKR